MAPPPSSKAARSRAVWRVARSGVRATTTLLRPVQGAQTDPWALAPARPASGLRLRRAAGLGVLALVTVLALSILGTLAMLLAIGVASGSDVAGWLLGVTLVLAVGVLLWARGRLMGWQPAPSTLPTEEAKDLQALRVLHQQARALPRPLRADLERTLQATAGALRATAALPTLTRDAFDVRQAARADLPELLHAYHAAPQQQPELRASLLVIEERMVSIARQGEQDAARAAQAQRVFVQEKYASTTAPGADGGKTPPGR
ncbi:hypothetical protein K7W42_12430 [Deinococcus sp. HMF7604]|uniref:hypothetical protein n=1 Tax=Deinococcus betulae TaxID=2873312 RepID=UPI001CC9B04B|nr:hypothetical protein [Deinococcus betulae]MBZ9751673.1 hypothetical protein [Deinococcus betulae]